MSINQRLILQGLLYIMMKGIIVETLRGEAKWRSSGVPLKDTVDTVCLFDVVGVVAVAFLTPDSKLTEQHSSTIGFLLNCTTFPARSISTGANYRGLEASKHHQSKQTFVIANDFSHAFGMVMDSWLAEWAPVSCQAPDGHISFC